MEALNVKSKPCQVAAVKDLRGKGLTWPAEQNSCCFDFPCQKIHETHLWHIKCRNQNFYGSYTALICTGIKFDSLMIFLL